MNSFRNTEEEEKTVMMKEKNIERRSKTGSKKKKRIWQNWEEQRKQIRKEKNFREPKS